jgi:sigma-B regulation protein RsbU (phosphoserine phosphatase)
MPYTGPPHLLLFTGDPERHDLRTILHQAGYPVGACALEEAANGKARTVQHAPAGRSGDGDSVGLVIVDGMQQPEQAMQLCHGLRHGQQEQFVPILYVAADGSTRDRVACLENGADAYLTRPFDPPELLAQVQALLRIKERHDQLAARAAEAGRVTTRLQAAYLQIDQELDLARRIQESFLPQTLPELPRVRFAVKYRPCGQVGGDFYDVFRLDERHVGFYVADAMGHGVPASLLTIFVKKGVRAKEINGQSYRLVPPDEVLGRLNRDLIDQALADMPFITMVYVLFDHQKGILRFSRAGHPHPLYLPADGPPRLLQLNGGLLGVFDTLYQEQTIELSAGDKLLLYTDGTDAAAFGEHAVGVPSLLAAATRFRKAPVGELVDRLAQDLYTQTRQTDDLTIMGLEVLEGPLAAS